MCSASPTCSSASARSPPSPALGVAVLGGARLHRAVWLALNAGAPAGVGFAHWLIYESLYVLGRICPYCAVVWAVTIALFWYVTLRNLRSGAIPVPAAGRRLLDLVLDTHGLLPAAWYGLIAVLVLTRFWSYWSSLLRGTRRPPPMASRARPEGPRGRDGRPWRRRRYGRTLSTGARHTAGPRPPLLPPRIERSPCDDLHHLGGGPARRAP